MSTLRILMFSFLVALVSIPLASSADPPEVAPSPTPELGSEVPSPASNLSPGTSSSSSPSPSPSHPLNSTPAPPPSDLAPDSAPAPAPKEKSPTPKEKSPTPAPAPAPGVASDISHETGGSGNIVASESSGGMKAGQKAGIAVGVIAGVFVVGIGALVYKKRQQNIRRAEFGYATRRGFL